jgi:arylsulfatase A-like enzyme
MPTKSAGECASAALRAVLLLSCFGCGVERRPNVVLISIDMLRADHLQCYGYDRPTSPNIDALAREGALFERNFASSSWTLPSHAAIFTSLPDSLHGCTDTDRALAPSATTLAERFQAAGYRTAGFFSGPYLHPAFGLGQGFEEYEDCTAYAKRIDGRPKDEWAMNPEVMVASHEDVTNERTYGAVEGWLAHRGEDPFFLFVHLWDAHFDFIPPAPYDTQFGAPYDGWVDGRNFFFDERYSPSMSSRDLQHTLALYDGEIAWTDSIVGRIRAQLDRRGLLDETVIALTSDHGTEFFDHGLKGHRRTLYDEVLHTPLILRYPRSIPAGRRVSALSRGIDLGATLLELAGLPFPDDIMGQSLMPLVR